MKDAPLISDNLRDDYRAFTMSRSKHTDAAGISYVEDPTLVRGLDYYTRTVFEVEIPNAALAPLA